MTIIIRPPYETIPGSAELVIQRRNTIAFIQADPIMITLTERPRVDTADGGWKWGAEVTREPQIMRLIPQTDVMTSVQTPDGIQLLPSYVLLGDHTAVMERWDTFELNDIKFMITSPIRPDVRLYSDAYERKADVARF